MADLPRCECIGTLHDDPTALACKVHEKICTVACVVWAEDDGHVFIDPPDAKVWLPEKWIAGTFVQPLSVLSIADDLHTPKSERSTQSPIDDYASIARDL